MMESTVSKKAPRKLSSLLWLSIAAAIVTISLKVGAWKLTGSVGLLSDAAESVVNLVAAVVALYLLYQAAKPEDEAHAYGHAKAEYFSAGIEGGLIFVAAVSIAVLGINRIIHPTAIDHVGIGLIVSAAASVVNLIVGTILVRAGTKQRSLLVEADGRHLIADVWTSVGVIIGVGLVALTGFERLDGIIAVLVALNILLTGFHLLRRSVDGLMDRALPVETVEGIQLVLDSFTEEGIQFHALRTRQAGQRAFISVHVLVPGEWSVQRGHDVVEDIEAALRRNFSYATVFTHLEPVEDPRSFEDEGLHRSDESDLHEGKSE